METAHEIKELENSAVELTLTVSKETVAEEYSKITAKYAKTLQIKGFRKGKAPISVLEKKFGEAFREETMYTIIENGIESALDEIEDVFKPLQYSTPKLLSEDELKLNPEEAFTYAVTYDVFPKFDIPEYSGFSVSVPDVEVGEEAVEEKLAALQEQNAVVLEKDVPAAEHLIVTVDYVELDENDTPLEGKSREDFVFTVGSGYNPFKFDDEIIGMKAGEKKIIEKTFADDYDIEEYAGKTVRIQVSVKAVKEREIPELDDEFAQDVSDEYETLEDLKQATRKKFEESLEARLREEKINGLYEKILENMEIQLPESMIQAELENSWSNFASQSRMSEEQLNQILELQGKHKNDLLEEWRPQALRSLKIQLLLDKITLKEGVSVSDDELAENEHLLDGIEDQRQKDYYQMMLRNDKKLQKTVDLLIEKNEFTKGDKVTYKEFLQQDR